MFTNNLVMFSFRSLTKILVDDQLQQRCFGAFHKVIQEPEHQSIQHSLESSSVDHSLDRVDLETALYKKTSVHSLVYVLDPFVKIRQCGILKFTTHTLVYMVLCILDMFYIHVCFNYLNKLSLIKSCEWNYIVSMYIYY